MAATPSRMTHHDESAARAIPAIDAAANESIAARFTDSAGAKPDAVKRTGPMRLSSVPRIPSE